MKPPIPWGRALVLGILPTVALAACTPLWLLAQMGGPVGFGQAWVICLCSGSASDSVCPQNEKDGCGNSVWSDVFGSASDLLLGFALIELGY